MAIFFSKSKNAFETSIDSTHNLEFDCKNKLVFVGLTDSHVHFRTPGHEYKEDWKSGSAAAVAGGITTVLDMPNTNPGTTNQQVINQKKEIAGRDSLCNFGFFLGATPDNAVEIESIQNATALKIYVGSSTGNLLVSEQNALERVFKAAKARGLPVCVHAEDEATIQQNTARAKQANWNHSRFHSRIRTDEAEALSIKQCLQIQQKIGNQLHVCHLTSAAGLELVAKAKHDFPDSQISCEVTPNHLFLTQEDTERLDNFAKINPSLKTKEDQRALWKGIRNQTVDMVATDHAPHTIEEKQKPYWDAPSGMTGVETMIPLLCNAVADEKLDWKDIERLCSANPQQIFGFSNPNCVTVIDPNKNGAIRNSDLFSKSKWSPFDGQTVRGKIELTVVNGHVVFENGKIFEQNRGVGQLVARS